MEKYCKTCGNLLVEGAKFCGVCGTAIEEEVQSQEEQRKAEKKAKIAQGAKIIGSASASALKGAVKWSAGMGVAMANLSTGGSMYHRESAMRDAEKSKSDFKNAARKLKALKGLKADTKVPQDIKETSAEFYEKNYDPALDDLDSLEHWSGFRNEDGSYSD